MYNALLINTFVHSSKVLKTSTDTGNFLIRQAKEDNGGVYKVVATSDGVSIEAECQVDILSKLISM